MAVIYLKHSKHGTKVACSEAEAKADEEKGWERYQLAALLIPGFSTPETHSREALAKEYFERFGKKPHHKKSVETLKAELA